MSPRSSATSALALALAGCLTGATGCSPPAPPLEVPADEAASAPTPALKTREVATGLTLVSGPDANALVFDGVDGSVVVDGAQEGATPRLLHALDALGVRAPRLLINTHWHPDHSGSNQALRERGAQVLAHANARRRMSADQHIVALNRRVMAAAPQARPTLTFRRQTTLHLGGERIVVRHVPRAHSDGDAVVYFENANVLHAGDVFLSHGYPFIDTSSGGSIRGTIEAVEMLLALADDDTLIVPGHGPVAGKDDLRAYREMLVAAESRVIALLDRRFTRDAIVAAQPMHDFDARWGNGPVSPARFLRIVSSELAAQ